MDWDIVLLMGNIIVVLNSYIVKIIALVKVENIFFIPTGIKFKRKLFKTITLSFIKAKYL